ncbi:MAG: DUF1592 domain-containing protein [bacterium]
MFRKLSLIVSPMKFDLKLLSLNEDQQETFLRQWFETAALTTLDKNEIENEQLRPNIRQQADEDAKAVMEHLLLEENKALRDLVTVPVLLKLSPSSGANRARAVSAASERNFTVAASTICYNIVRKPKRFLLRT